MSMSDSIRARVVEGSWIRKMFEEGVSLKKRLGEENVFDLSLGNPVMEPPPEFKKELSRLVNDPTPGMHRYMENAGYLETRTAVATRLARETGIEFKAGNIVMTCGAAGGLNVVLKTILNPGDEVIVFAPYFVEFRSYIDNHGGITRALPTDEHFLPKLDELDAAITPKTKGVIINSPNNPTGVVYSEKLVRQIGELLHQKEVQHGTQIFLISDEAYRKILYDGLKYVPVFHHYRNSIAIVSHSKDLSIPGERIGYIAIHPECSDQQEVMNGFVFCNRVLGFVNAPALMQNVLRNLEDVTVSIAEYQKKRDFLYRNLVEMGYSVVKPGGAFYFFPQSPVEDDVAFVNELLQSNILVVPGRGFGGPGYFRVSYCVDDRTIEGSLAGFRKAALKFNLC
ncbi:MAG: pyridoxal phosphate-dependent aminotransferase [Dehalococcoidia bacterium]